VKAGRLSVISLLTDFGTADYFVGAVKGAILSVNPEAVIVDITHEIARQDISAGAFTLLAAYKTFPAGTVHVAVVDPGVGSTRRAIIVKANEQFFVGPDNGLFTYIYDRESEHHVFHVTAEKYFRRDPSSTFHGRDIFAPVAAALSNGVKPRKFGPRISDAIRLDIPLEPEVLPNGDVRGRVINVDHFGNCVTNITRELLKPNATLVVNRKTIREFRDFYGEAPSGTPFAIWGSAGFLELSVNGGSAAELLQAQTGTRVLLTFRT
jgi:S-adenosyl-L-methionine hydrolase (adenosine-forming)